MKTIESRQRTYPVVETFHSIQGEGCWAGMNAFFIRLGGCDVGCGFCDTKESWNPKSYPQLGFMELADRAKQANPGIVVITGGEPLMHDLTLLTAALHGHSLQVHLETSGAYPLTGDFDWITLSPKQSKSPHPDIYEWVEELKVVIATEADFEWAEKQAALLDNVMTVKSLQPEWNTPESQALVFNYVLQNPGWRLSLQTHKFLGVR